MSLRKHMMFKIIDTQSKNKVTVSYMKISGFLIGAFRFYNNQPIICFY